MSSKPENQFIQSVHKHLPAELHREKMNNPYRGGTADVWYSGSRADLWIEYKFLPKIPVRTQIKADLTPLQIAWLSGRYKEGRDVWVVIGCKDGGVVLEHMDWTTELSPEEFRERLCTRPELAKRIMWHTLRNIS